MHVLTTYLFLPSWYMPDMIGSQRLSFRSRANPVAIHTVTFSTQVQDTSDPRKQIGNTRQLLNLFYII